MVKIEKLSDDLINLNKSDVENIAKVKKTLAKEENRVNSKIADIMKAQDDITEALNKTEYESIPKLLDELKQANKALKSTDDLHTYIKSFLVDEKAWESMYKMEKLNPGMIYLDTQMEYSERARELAKIIRDDFKEIGLKEVEIGKLDREAYEMLKDSYLPRFLTEDGFAVVTASEIDEFKKVSNFGERYGYGRVFNPHSIERKIKFIPDGAGGYIENPNVFQINEFYKREFDDVLKGKNVFSENLAEIYTARMLKNNELVYDNAYMENMLNMFGKDYDGFVEEGYNAVSNFGMLKKSIHNNARVKRSMWLSKRVGEQLKKPEVIKGIDEITAKRVAERFAVETESKVSNILSMSHMLKSSDAKTKKYWDSVTRNIRSEETKKYIDSFIKEPKMQDTMRDLYNTSIDDILEVTGSKMLINDLAVPMVELSDKQIEVFKYVSARNRSEFFQHTFNKKFSTTIKDFMYYNLEKGSDEFIKFSKMINDIEKVTINGGMPDSKLLQEMQTILNETLKKDGLQIADRHALSTMDRKVKMMLGLEDLQIKQVNSHIVNRANNARKVQIVKDQNRFLQIFDKWQHLIKLNQTTVLPSFHGRNLVSNNFNSWLVLGADVLDYDIQKKAHQAVWKGGNIEGVLEGTDYTWKKLFQEATDYGVLEESFFLKDARAGVATEGVLKKLPPHLDPTDSKNFIGYKKGAQAGTFIENSDRFVHFAAAVRQGKNFEEAAESVTRTLFDYSDLSEFEKNVLKRIIPYYTWIKNNARLQLDIMTSDPKRYSNIPKVIGSIENMTEKDERMDRRFIEDYAQDWIETPMHYYNADGQKIRVLFNPNLPYDDINRIPNPLGGDFIKNALGITTPIIKVPLEIAANKNTFFDSPITYPNQSAPRKAVEYSKHALNNLGWYNIGKGMANSDDVAVGLHVNNNLTGLKFSSYNYDKFKERKIRELAKKKEKSQSIFRR